MTTTVEVRGCPVDFDTQYGVCYTLIYPNGTRVRHAVRGPNTPQGLVGTLRALADHLENYLPEKEPTQNASWASALYRLPGEVRKVGHTIADELMAKQKAAMEQCQKESYYLKFREEDPAAFVQVAKLNPINGCESKLNGIVGPDISAEVVAVGLNPLPDPMDLVRRMCR